jgi:hypothetical protein
MGKLEIKIVFVAFLTVLTFFSLSSCREQNETTSFSPDRKLATTQTNEAIVGKDKNVKVHKVLGNYKTFSSDDELSQFADLVVIGKPTVNLDETSFRSSSESESKSKKHQENESIVVRDSSGNVIDAYSITLFRVQKYLKGSLKDKQIRVLQPTAYIREPGKSPYLWLQEGSSPMEKKSKYILFLKEVDTATYPNLKGVYSIISVNQGKFNLDKSDSKELDIEKNDGQYRQLKEKVRKRHESDFNSTPDL